MSRSVPGIYRLLLQGQDPFTACRSDLPNDLAGQYLGQSQFAYAFARELSFSSFGHGVS